MGPLPQSDFPPPAYYLEPYNYELLLPISFAPSKARKSDEEARPTQERNVSAKRLKSQREPWKMASLFSEKSKYLGYEKANDLEASDASSSQADSTESSSTTGSIEKKSRIDARVISDAIIGLSDGMTVPFALTAGLSAIGDTRIVIYGGFAELCAGAISMGLGGYLGAKSEALVTLIPTLGGMNCILVWVRNEADRKQSLVQSNPGRNTPGGNPFSLHRRKQNPRHLLHLQCSRPFGVRTYHSSHLPIGVFHKAVSTRHTYIIPTAV